MNLRSIPIALAFLLGASVGVLAMWLAVPAERYRSVIGQTHFLLREGDAASARASYEQTVPWADTVYLTRAQLKALDQALRSAAVKHVE